MFSRVASTFARKRSMTALSSSFKNVQVVYPAGHSYSRSMTTLEESATARCAWEKSCYYEMDFTVPDDALVFEAVQKFAAYDIGCLVTTNSKGEEILSTTLRIYYQMQMNDFHKNSE